MKTWGLLVVLLLSAGCTSSTRVQVVSRASTNAGQPVYMMVRTGEQLELEEPYEQAAQRMFTRNKDAKRVERQVILPGSTFNVTIATPEEDVGIYFFFTKYQEKVHRFRLVVSRSKLPAEIFIELGDSEIDNSTYRER